MVQKAHRHTPDRVTVKSPVCRSHCLPFRTVSHRFPAALSVPPMMPSCSLFKLTPSWLTDDVLALSATARWRGILCSVIICRWGGWKEVTCHGKQTWLHRLSFDVQVRARGSLPICGEIAPSCGKYVQMGAVEKSPITYQDSSALAQRQQWQRQKQEMHMPMEK